uniref:Uncharacterized protein n=1 Tax=Kalanchoe fedtschenkoi TaxID=63787 RepID=A0A7N0TCI2_KALFE
MTSRTTGMPEAQGSRSSQGERPHWVLIAGGALLSSLSIHLGYKLKQAMDSKQQNPGRNSTDNGRAGNYRLHSNDYSFTHDGDTHFSYDSANGGTVGRKHAPNGHMMTEPEGALPLVTVPTPGYAKENGVMWTSSPDRLELQPKPFHHSNCSLSPSVSESGSEVFSKREVIHKLRQQLKRRDDMILEMQDQIVELQNSLNSQSLHAAHLQTQLDAANQELFDSEREIQRLRKAIADHCVGHVSPSETGLPIPVWPSVGMNGHSNGYHNHETNLDTLENGRGTSDRVQMLRVEVGELKEVIEAKDYLLQSYKEQKTEMSVKIKELQHRLDSQLHSIL